MAKKETLQAQYDRVYLQYHETKDQENYLHEDDSPEGVKAWKKMSAKLDRLRQKLTDLECRLYGGR